MAIDVYGWRKPTLELELVSGGSLVANTTYYICGIMKFPTRIYCGVSAPISDVYSITTTSTAKSIKITQKTYRDITQFTNNGDGKTLITCPRHCLITNDVIKIATGSYAGTWTITKVNADTFTINTLYVDNVPVQCYSDSINYGKPPNAAQFTSYSTKAGMIYFVHTTNPISNGFWVGPRNRFTDGAYQLEVANVNPTTISAVPTRDLSGTINMTIDNLGTSIFKEVAENYGSILVVVDSAVTLQNIYDAVVAAGFPLNCFYATRNKSTFMLIGSGVFLGGSSLNATSINMTVIGGEFCSVGAASISLTGSMINTIPDTFSAAYTFTANGSVFYNNATINTTTGYIYGDDCTLYEAPRLASNPADVPNQKYIDLVTGQQKTYGIVQNKTFKDIGDSMLIQISYNTNKFINCKMYPLYWILTNDDAGTNPNIYMIENSFIKQSGSNLYHIRLSNTYNRDYASHLRFLNVNTDDPNNVKKVVNILAATAPLASSFYRRAKFYIKNQVGETLDNVHITIRDSSDNIYTGVTDSSGYTFIDCLEQRTIFENIGASSVHRPEFDTYYTNFTITISKEGYDDEIIKLYKLYQTGYYDTVLNISLNPISNIYYNQQIEGSIDTTQISGSISSDSLSGSITTDDLIGTVESFQIVGTTE